MKVGVPKESIKSERRVALVPELVPKLTAAGLDVCVENGAGLEAGFSDSEYENNGAHVVQDAFAEADVVLKVRAPGSSEAKAVLLAANRLPKFFPLLMTAAGTIAPARVLVIGAGVAGLQAIGTAKRLGAVVEAYDTRAGVKEEVESVGGRFIYLSLEAAGTGKAGEYAGAQTEQFYRRQQQLMAEHVASADVVIAAALVRGVT